MGETTDVDWEFIKAIGRRIVALRKSQKLSQFDLAVKVGIERSQMGRIERGEINTTVNTLKKVAEGLEIEIGELFEKY
ncbi:MAG: helix-turn-helix transcriptional regulator [Bacteroidia bacterium]|nr:helix-turn-helix transcriptional regulator [Bacteroidia bacterium]